MISVFYLLRCSHVMLMKAVYISHVSEAMHACMNEILNILINCGKFKLFIPTMKL